ncbi:hypothetical protein M3Y97_00093100 [Aphelenchoides bicaudatus]|nr:hypothetical protein M3Y97_00093100 [Aphelenchoides bicaudatus]
MTVKNEDGWSVKETISKAFTRKADFGDDKDALLDVIYWGRQIISLLVGVVFGLIPLKGLIAILLYVAISTFVGHFYVTSFQEQDEEALGGFMELNVFFLMYSSIVYLLPLLFTHALCQQTQIAALLITQQWPYELEHARKFEEQSVKELTALEVNHVIFKTHADFEKYIGAWGIWSILKKLSDRSQNASWILIAEPYTQVDWTKLLELTNTLNADEEHFLGRALYDKEPVIIHHYHGFQNSEKRLYYPDFAGGVLLSRGALKRISNAAPTHDKSDFTIDAKFEFAKFINDNTGIELKNVPEFCLLANETNCITKYEEPTYSTDELGCGDGISKEQVFYAVKTYSGFHKSRIVIVKRTWAHQTKFIEYFSDTVDVQVPTIDLKVPNAEQGHCAKTIAILKYFLKNEEFKHINWIVVADDDSLLNVDRLHKIINCLPTRMILGERYGFGFEYDGVGGYDYPTGGSGFVMSRETARFIAYSCGDCSPVDLDDMHIGRCARRLNIPILHSSAFHQAQRRAYNPLYIQRIQPISFHKFEDLDPYKEYLDYLKTPNKPVHTEL